MEIVLGETIGDAETNKERGVDVFQDPGVAGVRLEPEGILRAVEDNVQQFSLLVSSIPEC